jgi:invasion protein IalB
MARRADRTGRAGCLLVQGKTMTDIAKRLLVAALCLAPFGAAPAAFGQGGGAPAPWAARCTGEGRAGPLDCVMEQRVVITNTSQLLAGITIRQPPGGAAPVMMIQVPYGLYLPAGLKLVADGRPFDTLPLQTCNDQGCFAGSTVSAELLAALKAGTTLEVTMQDQSQRDVTVPVSLSGFSDAFTRIQ